MTPASLRPATELDLESILEIELKSFPNPWALAQFSAELMVPYSRFFVLTDDETDEMILAYIIYRIQADGVSLLNLAVHPAWRGLKFAEKMMRAMIHETVRDEIPKIILEVRPSNRGAIRLYTELGFKLTHERKNFYQNGESALIMELKTSDLSGIIQ